MNSMTGYGRASVEADGRLMTIELRSVNHRFLDLAFRMPRNLLFLEDVARKQIGAALSRGHVDIYVTYANHRSDSKTVRADATLMRAYLNALEALGSPDLPDDRTLLKLASFPDVLTVTEADEDRQALTDLLTETLTEALDGLCAMRTLEGAHLAGSLSERLDALEALAQKVALRGPEVVEAYRARLRATVESFVGGAVDEARLLTEVALMADRGCIDEELVRLASHISQVRACLQAREPVGRRLDFLVQELNREVNTITSKSQDVPITNLAVDMKAEIEKIREQVQNVE